MNGIKKIKSIVEFMILKEKGAKSWSLTRGGALGTSQPPETAVLVAEKKEISFSVAITSTGETSNLLVTFSLATKFQIKTFQNTLIILQLKFSISTMESCCLMRL